MLKFYEERSASEMEVLFSLTIPISTGSVAK